MPEETIATLLIRIKELEKRNDERDKFRQLAIDRATSQQNEWGRAFQDLKANFVTSDRYEASHESLVQRYEQGHKSVVGRQDDVIGRLSRLEGSETKGQFNTLALMQLIGTLTAIVMALIALFKTGAL